jgi:hypothetical protein
MTSAVDFPPPKPSNSLRASMVPGLSYLGIARKSDHTSPHVSDLTDDNVLFVEGQLDEIVRRRPCSMEEVIAEVKPSTSVVWEGAWISVFYSEALGRTRCYMESPTSRRGGHKLERGPILGAQTETLKDSLSYDDHQEIPPPETEHPLPFPSWSHTRIIVGSPRASETTGEPPILRSAPMRTKG